MPINREQIILGAEYPNTCRCENANNIFINFREFRIDKIFYRIFFFIM